MQVGDRVKVVRKQCSSTAQSHIGKSGHIQARHSGSGECGQNECWWVSEINGGTCFRDDELEVIAGEPHEFKVGEWAEHLPHPYGEHKACWGCRAPVVSVYPTHIGRDQAAHVGGECGGKGLCFRSPDRLKPCPAPTEKAPEFKVGQWCEFIAHYPEREQCWGCRAKIVQVLYEDAIVDTTTRTRKKAQCSAARCWRNFKDIAPCAAPREEPHEFRVGEWTEHIGASLASCVGCRAPIVEIRPPRDDWKAIITRDATKATRRCVHRLCSRNPHEIKPCPAPTEDKPPQRGVERSCEMRWFEYAIVTKATTDDEGKSVPEGRVVPADEDGPMPRIFSEYGGAELEQAIRDRNHDAIMTAGGNPKVAVLVRPFGQ